MSTMSATKKNEPEIKHDADGLFVPDALGLTSLSLLALCRLLVAYLCVGRAAADALHIRWQAQGFIISYYKLLTHRTTNKIDRRDSYTLVLCCVNQHRCRRDNHSTHASCDCVPYMLPGRRPGWEGRWSATRVRYVPTQT